MPPPLPSAILILRRSVGDRRGGGDRRLLIDAEEDRMVRAPRSSAPR